MIAHLSIERNCKNGKPYGGYECAKVTYRSAGEKFKSKRFASGDPAQDFANCVIWLYGRDDVERVMMSSSCDNFTSDVGGWRWYENGVMGELIRSSRDRKPWHIVVRQHGKNRGRLVHVQDGGQFVVVDNKDGLVVLNKVGIVEPPKGKPWMSAKDAMERCVSMRSRVIWEDSQSLQDTISTGARNSSPK